MKISVILVGGAQALTCGNWYPRPCKLDEWINFNWWASAVETFNSVSDNREQFADAAQTVSWADYFSKESNEIFQIDPVVFRQLFDWLDSNADSEVSAEELLESPLTSLLSKIDHRYSDEFKDKYWHIFDTDNSGKLNFEENMYTIAGIADGFARLIIKVSKLTSAQLMRFSLQGFDENGNGILDGQETVNWNETVEQSFTGSWRPFMAAVKRAFTDSEMDDDFSTGTEIELVQFGLRLWNSLVTIHKL